MKIPAPRNIDPGTRHLHALKISRPRLCCRVKEIRRADVPAIAILLAAIARGSSFRSVVNFSIMIDSAESIIA
jgi:hypothetical protein